MAANGSSQAFAPVLAALSTMESNVDRAQKGQAHEYLEQFQKSVCPADSMSINAIKDNRASANPCIQAEAWTSTISMLQTQDATFQAKLFAATTLKGKVCVAPLPTNTHLVLER